MALKFAIHAPVTPKTVSVNGTMQHAEAATAPRIPPVAVSP